MKLDYSDGQIYLALSPLEAIWLKDERPLEDEAGKTVLCVPQTTEYAHVDTYRDHHDPSKLLTLQISNELLETFVEQRQEKLPLVERLGGMLSLEIVDIPSQQMWLEEATSEKLYNKLKRVGVICIDDLKLIFSVKERIPRTKKEGWTATYKGVDFGEKDMNELIDLVEPHLPTCLN